MTPYKSILYHKSRITKYKTRTFPDSQVKLRIQTADKISAYVGLNQCELAKLNETISLLD